MVYTPFCVSNYLWNALVLRYWEIPIPLFIHAGQLDWMANKQTSSKFPPCCVYIIQSYYSLEEIQEISFETNNPFYVIKAENAGNIQHVK